MPSKCHNALGPFLNERDRRLFAASEARAAGRGGIAAVSHRRELPGSTGEVVARRISNWACSERPAAGGQNKAIEIQPGILKRMNWWSRRSGGPRGCVAVGQPESAPSLRGAGQGKPIARPVGWLLETSQLQPAGQLQDRKVPTTPIATPALEHAMVLPAAAGQPVISVGHEEERARRRILKMRSGSRSRSGA